jgi:hypothetical protein
LCFLYPVNEEPAEMTPDSRGVRVAMNMPHHFSIPDEYMPGARREFVMESVNSKV